MSKLHSQARRLSQDGEGIAAVEFAFIAPVFAMLLLVVFDTGFSMYATAVLRGEVENAARKASLENHIFEDLKSAVSTQVGTVVPSSSSETEITLDFDQKYYANYSNVNRPEDFTDANGDGDWDPNECFIDRNANNTFDRDVGVAGEGGAQDVVAITGDLQFDRVFPAWSLMGAPSEMKLTASTYLRNQPFTSQASRVGVRICP